MGVRSFEFARMGVVGFCVMGLMLVFGSASALALAPEITSPVSFSNVGSSSAVVSAQISPGGEPTTYRFEYTNPETSETYLYKTPEPPGEVSGSSPVGVLGHLEGLKAETLYRVRIIVTNASGTAQSSPSSFTTYPSGILGLPDARGYELVTAVANGDSDVYEPLVVEGGNALNGTADATELPFRAAADGNGVVYVSTPGSISSGGSGSTGLHKGNQNLATRSPGGGWITKNIQPVGYRNLVIYQAFSNDLSIGILDTTEVLVAGAPTGGYDIPYESLTSDDSYDPLFAVTPPTRSADEFGAPGVHQIGGQRVSTGPEGSVYHRAAVAYAGSSTDMSHLLFEVNDALTPLAKENVPTSEQNDLYDVVEGLPQLVNVLPDGTPDPNATFGGLGLATEGGNGTQPVPDFDHVISADGSRIFWTDLETGDLYVRENDTQPQSLAPGGKCIVPADACTVAVSTGAAQFWTASTDGRYVFYTEAGNLYRFDVQTRERTPLTSNTTGTGDISATTGTGDLNDGSKSVTSVVTLTGIFAIGQQIEGPCIPVGTTIVAVGSGTLELSANAMSSCTGASLTGSSNVVSSVLTTAGKFLAGEPISGSGIPLGTRILKVTVNTLVLSNAVTAAGTDVALTSSPEVKGVVGSSQDGSFVYFVAGGVLASGAPSGGCCNLYVLHQGEVVRFVAMLSATDESSGGGGKLAHGDWIPGIGLREAQVTADGSHLAFISHEQLTTYKNYDRQEVYVYDASTGSAGLVSCVSCNPSGMPPSTSTFLPISWSSSYAQRFLSSDGSRVFFDSDEALVPQDANGQRDVYEWEQDGSGECHREGGCLYLLSGGTSTDGSFFLDASTSGDDVFVITRAQLLSQDQNEVFDVYDARVGASVPIASPACTGSGCQGLPGSPPIFATPSSVTFNGVGNFEAPRKSVVKHTKKKKKLKKKRKAKKRAGKSNRAHRHGKAHSMGNGARMSGKAGRS